MISGHSSEVVPVIHRKWFLSFIGSGSGHSSEVVPVIRLKWFRSFVGSGSGHSSEVVPVIHRKWQDVTEYLRIFFESCYIRHRRRESLPGQSHCLLKQLLNKQNDYGKCSFGCDKGSQKYQKVQG